MPPYASSEQLYGAMQLLFDQLSAQKPGPMDSLAASRLTIRFRLLQPEAEITINGRAQPARMLYGKNHLRPDLQVEMQADLLHRILIREASIRESFAGGKLKVLGPIWKTQVLVDILEAGRTLYPAIVRENGLPLS